MTTIIRWMVQLILCIILLSLSGWTTVGDPEPVEWVPYTTAKHSEMGYNSGFSDRIYRYLSRVKKLKGKQLKIEFRRWYPMNLGHVFEEASLASYGILKNNRLFNGRIPDGVEDGKLEQIVQFTDYPASTFIEAKYKSIISLYDPQIRHQIIDMIDFLSANNLYRTVRRFVSNDLTRVPGKASEEDLAVLLFLTPANTEVSKELLQYAKRKRVKIYQMKMYYNPVNSEMVVLAKPQALSGISLHFHGHAVGPFPVLMNWQKHLIDPDTGKEIIGY
ncbi:MAG: hypothetical protein AAF587_38300 [Bacteroidota bacterium]